MWYAPFPPADKKSNADVLYQLWVEQPVGTGFSIGTPTISNESELADQFYGFLCVKLVAIVGLFLTEYLSYNRENFYATFPELVSKKLFITGESYAGFYIPYIATRIVDASSSEKAALPLDLQGLLINDGVYSSLYGHNFFHPYHYKTDVRSVANQHCGRASSSR